MQERREEMGALQGVMGRLMAAEVQALDLALALLRSEALEDEVRAARQRALQLRAERDTLAAIIHRLEAADI